MYKGLLVPFKLYKTPMRYSKCVYTCILYSSSNRYPTLNIAMRPQYLDMYCKSYDIRILHDCTYKYQSIENVVVSEGL